MKKVVWFAVLAVLVGAALFLWNRQPVVRIQHTLNVLGEDTGTLAAIEAVKGRFEAATGIKVNCIKETFEALQQKASTDLSSGSGLYDIISLASYSRNGWVYSLSELKTLEPSLADEALERDLFPETWHEVGFFTINPAKGPEAVGYPFAANTMLLVYNKSLFERPAEQQAYRKRYRRELAPPKDWVAFREVAEFFTRPKEDQFGLVLQGASGGWLYYEWVNFAYSMGGGVMKKERGWQGDASTPLILGSPETQKATQFYVDLRPFSQGDFFSTGQNEQGELMRGGRAAMAIMWSDTLFAMLRAAPSQEFGFAPIPGGRSQIGGGSFYVNRHSKEPRLAAQFIHFLLQTDTQTELLQLGLCPPRRSAFQDAAASKVPYAKALQEALENAVYMAEAGPDSDLVQETVTAAVQKIARGAGDTATVLKAAQTDLEKKRSEIFAAVK